MDVQERLRAQEQARHEAYLAELRSVVAWARAYWVGRYVWWQLPYFGQVGYGLVESVDDLGRVLVVSGYDAQGKPLYDERVVSDLDHRLFLLPQAEGEQL